MFLRPTSPTEIYNVIFQLNSNKSCGFDGINANFVITASEVLSPISSILINACFDLGVFSSVLKIAKVIPVFKEGDKGKVSNHRPISLPTVFSKILEKLVYARTVVFLNSHSVLVPTQYGFRPKFSTIHAVLDIITSCYDNMAINMYTGFGLLDLAKAFDTVNHNILLKKLDHYGIRGIVNDFFRSYLTNRRQIVSISNSNSSLKFINVGVPQGSNLGFLLFLLFINDLPNCLESVPRLFADDTCLQVCAPSVEQLELKLNSELTKICKWMFANKLTLNASKSQALIISPKLRCSPVCLNLRCPAGTIKSVNNAKYLGITLDNRLNFREHIKITETKVARSVGILSKLKYYLPESAMLQLYYPLVHSQLMYGVAVWGNTFPSILQN